MDPRNVETAKQCGIGSEVDALWDPVGKYTVKMCRLTSALTILRLGKQEKKFPVISHSCISRIGFEAVDSCHGILGPF